MPSEITDRPDDRDLSETFIKQITALTTSGFGLVAALAWNNVINEVVNSYLKPYFQGSGMLSLLFYAITITLFAVFVTWQLSKAEARFRDINRSIKSRVNQLKNHKLTK